MYSQHLCYNSKPVVIWMVGVLRWNRLIDPIRWNVGIRFFCAEDDNAAREMKGRRSEPPYGKFRIHLDVDHQRSYYVRHVA